jgi:hypothetical protein
MGICKSLRKARQLLGYLSDLAPDFKQNASDLRNRPGYILEIIPFPS